MHQFFENLFAGIGVTDIIDILIVAFIIYVILGFIRESRAEQLVKGIVVLLAVAFLSRLLRLYVVSWLVDSFLEVGLIILVILFQPELRRALERLGGGRLFQRSSTTLDKERAKLVAEEFVDAVWHMTVSKTGAIIVFERQSSLSKYCETGTMLDSEISAPAIENIFYKGSPLHDGALLVRGDRLLAAGCVLPLSERLDLPVYMGTRHRAALGITEDTDAVAVIVSEETGRISFCREGGIEEDIDIRTLEQRLLALFRGEDPGEEEEGA